MSLGICPLNFDIYTYYINIASKNINKQTGPLFVAIVKNPWSQYWFSNIFCDENVGILNGFQQLQKWHK